MGDDIKPTVIWEWEDDGSKWTKYDSTTSKKIHDAFTSSQIKTSFTNNGVQFDVLLDRMVQRNSKTFWERRIRANIQGEDGGLSGTWQWQDENGVWNLYKHDVQRLLYAAEKCNMNKVSFSFRKQKYNIDLDNMVQENFHSVTKRPIRKTGDGNDVTTVNSTAVSSSNRKRAVPDTENDTESSVTNVASKRQKSSKKPAKASETTSEPEEKIAVKTVVMKGKAPVDSECFVKDQYHVYSEGSTVYDAMLNQTNLKNNNNKFFLLQVLKHNSSGAYAVWLRWGRVSYVGQTNLVQCGSLDEAKEVFCKKFSDKTKNEFEDRKRFKKVAGKYDLLKMDYSATDKENKDQVDGAVKREEKKMVPSKLDKKIQDLIELICNVKEMEEAVLEMKYDANKAPLGKLTKDQIKAGFQALKKIDECIRKNDLHGDKIIKACDAFYTRIPHCFGFQRPPIIRTKEQVKAKAELLEMLGDIEIALKVIKEEEEDLMLHPIDRHYAALKSELKALDHNSEEFSLIDKYVQNTHAKTHNQYKMEVVDVFECNIKGQTEQFNDVGNKMLLWHGSRLTNYVGILSKGLRIAPPEAPVTGYMFGKGVYFADMSSKSANYCYPTRNKNIGFVLLCEVSLGKTNDLLAADYEADQLPEGCHSTKGLGKIGPDESQMEKLGDVSIPLGKPKDTGIVNPDGYTLNYNEYVVYDVRQVKTRYMVQLKFNFV